MGHRNRFEIFDLCRTQLSKPVNLAFIKPDAAATGTNIDLDCVYLSDFELRSIVWADPRHA